MKLRGRNVWLIGASTGIGAALAPALTAQGARLAISARNEEELAGVAARASMPDAPVAVYPLDVTDRAAIERVAGDVREALGQIDVLIYNAGTYALIGPANFDVDAFEQQIAVNYTGMVRAIGAVLPEMVKRRSGDIVGVASLTAYGAFPKSEAYGSTKAAVNHLLQALRIDARRLGIGVTTVNPGFVRTEMTNSNTFPMPFRLEPEQAAEAIVAGMLAGRDEIHFPRRLSLPLKVLTALPRPLYEFIVSRAVRR